MLFFGFLGREILMDINDVVDDRLHRIKTVPVRYGRDVAARVALASTSVMAVTCLAGVVLPPVLLGHGRCPPRQVACALVGCVAQLRRAYQVSRTGGTSKELVDKAVEEGKVTVLFLLASYI